MREGAGARTGSKAGMAEQGRNPCEVEGKGEGREGTANHGWGVRRRHKGGGWGRKQVAQEPERKGGGRRSSERHEHSSTGVGVVGVGWQPNPCPM